MKLQRSITLIGLLFTSIGCMVGSGWLFGAHYAAQIAGPASILSWLLGGILITFIALTFSELSTMLPLAGGISRFSQFSHGTFVSFCLSWLAWLSCVAVAPTEVQAILQYSSSYFPGLTHHVNDVPVLTSHGFFVAAILMFIMSYLNMLGIKTLTRSNTAITAWKLIIPFLAAFMIIGSRFHISNFTAYQGFAPSGLHGVLWSLPTAGIIFSFLGFREATSLAGEAKLPSIAIPFAVIGSVIICTILYVVVQVAFIGSIDSSMLQHGWSHLHFVGDSGPIAGIVSSIGIGWLVILIYVDSLVSPFGTGLIYTATTSRLNYAMSMNRYMPHAMLKLNERGVPVRAILINYVIGLLLFLPLPTWQALVGFQSTAIVLAYGVGPISLLTLRKQAPHLARPFKLPASKFMATLTFYICNLISYWTGWETIWRLMISILLGIAILLIYRHYEKAEKYNLNLKSAYWLIPYFGGLSLISYLGNFGGGIGIISFGWDFAILGIFTLIIMKLAFDAQLDTAETQSMLPDDEEMNLENTEPNAYRTQTAY